MFFFLVALIFLCCTYTDVNYQPGYNSTSDFCVVVDCVVVGWLFVANSVEASADVVVDNAAVVFLSLNSEVVSAVENSFETEDVSLKSTETSEQP